MIAPQLATPYELKNVGLLVMDDDFVAEQKLDGHRVMLIGPGSSAPAALTRGGASYTKGIPTPIRNWRATGHATDHFILDGELVGTQYWAFDFLLDDGSLNAMPLRDRRVVLEQFFGLFPDCPFHLTPQARTTQEKETLLIRAASENLEGLVFKNASSVYHYGLRSPVWLKAKFVQTADVVILSVRDDGKESARLGVYRPNGSMLEVGRCSLIGKPAVKVGDVAEVRYLYVAQPKPGTIGRLYQPTLIRVRDDKSYQDCDGSDFKYTSKAVLETL